MDEKILTLGVDMGIASIGWALIEGRVEGEGMKPERIVESGVRIFTRAENPKTKESLALPRRSARSARRRTARRRARMLKIKNFLAQSLSIPMDSFTQEQKLARFFKTSKDFASPWELRASALDRILSKEELARIILHIAKRRGYDDITYSLDDEKSKEEGKMKKAISDNLEAMKKSDCRTIGEMMAKLYYGHENVRNKKDNYNRSIGRSELRKELEIIFSEQEKYGNPYITSDFKNKLLGIREADTKREREGIIFYQRPLKSFSNMIGKCQFFKKEKRTCKGSPSAEEFVALTKIINFLKWLENYSGVVYDPSDIERVLQEAKKNKTGLKYSKFKTILKLPDDFKFTGLDYSGNNPEAKVFISLKNSAIFAEKFPGMELETQNKIANILGENKDWEAIVKQVKNLGLSDEQIEILKTSKLACSEYINLSLKALDEILPLMRSGKRYDEAVRQLQDMRIFPVLSRNEAKLLPSLHEKIKEDPYFDIPNPMINKALGEFRKVANALIEKYGVPHYFNIELTRDVALGKKARREMEDRMRKNERENEEAYKKLQEFGISNSYKNRLKCRLWIQQNGKCIYTGRSITREHLIDSNVLQIDHAMPYSRSLDDSQDNKVLCFTSNNQEKQNKTPYEWLGSDPEKWSRFVGLVEASGFSRNKKNKLKQTVFKDRSMDEFLQRSLVNTGYIGKVVKEYILTSLKLPSLPNGKKEHMRVIPGSLTSTMRSFWGIPSKDRGHHLHHAQDAIIIACIQNSAIQAYIDFVKDKEQYKPRPSQDCDSPCQDFVKDKELHKLKSEEKAQKMKEDYKTRVKLSWPLENFPNQVQESIEKITVSHRVSRKVTGELHQATAYGKEEVLIPLKDRKIKTVEGEEKKDNGGLYFADAEQRDLAIQLGKVREVNGAIVKNGEMIRTDIFRSKDKGKFYAVPIYTFDFALGKLPNKAIVQSPTGKLKDWLEMDESYEFCFSLFKNDCIRLQTKDMQEPCLVVYKGIHSGTAVMSFEHLSRYAATPDEEILFTKGVQKTGTTGIQNLKCFQKVQLSPLGEIRECKPSKRQEIRLKSSPKNV